MADYVESERRRKEEAQMIRALDCLSGAARTGVIRDRFHSLDRRVWLKALCESLETWEAFEHAVDARHAARVGQHELDLRFA